MQKKAAEGNQQRRMGFVLGKGAIPVFLNRGVPLEPSKPPDALDVGSPRKRRHAEQGKREKKKVPSQLDQYPGPNKGVSEWMDG